MQWRPLLYSAMLGRDYGFAILSPHDEAIAEISRQTTYSTPSWLVGSSGNSIFFGKRGWIDDVLGPEHPRAYDQSRRRSEFFLGYTAPHGTQLPRFANLGQLENLLREDLERLWKKLDKAQQGLKEVEPTSLPDFGLTPLGDHAWDKAVADIERGRATSPLLVDQHGNTRVLDVPTGERTASPRVPRRVEDDRIRAAEETNFKKKRGIPSLKRAVFFKITAVTLLAVIGYTMWKLISSERNSANRKKQQESALTR